MGEKLGSPAFCVRDGSCDLLSKRFAVPLFNDAKDSALVRITLARRRRRISTHSMAERLQVSTATLRRLERGESSLSVGSDRNGCRIQRLWSLRCFRAFRLSFFRHVVIGDALGPTVDHVGTSWSVSIGWAAGWPSSDASLMGRYSPTIYMGLRRVAELRHRGVQSEAREPALS